MKYNIIYTKDCEPYLTQAIISNSDNPEAEALKLIPKYAQLISVELVKEVGANG